MHVGIVAPSNQTQVSLAEGEKEEEEEEEEGEESEPSGHVIVTTASFSSSKQHPKREGE